MSTPAETRQRVRELNRLSREQRAEQDRAHAERMAAVKTLTNPPAAKLTIDPAAVYRRRHDAPGEGSVTSTSTPRSFADLAATAYAPKSGTDVIHTSLRGGAQ